MDNSKGKTSSESGSDPEVPTAFVLSEIFLAEMQIMEAVIDGTVLVLHETDEESTADTRSALLRQFHRVKQSWTNLVVRVSEKLDTTPLNGLQVGKSVVV